MLIDEGVSAEGRVVCPICGETFEDTTEECPNDGANLKIVGVPAETDDTETPSEDSDEEASGESRRHPIKYKRHDKGGERQPAERPESGYSDRISRIPGDKRYAAEPKSAPSATGESPEPFQTARDEEIRSRFEDRRQALMRQRRVETERRGRGKKGPPRPLDSMGAPLTSLGFRIFWMAEGNDPGPVGAAEIDINLQKNRFRAGVSALLGMRDLEDRNELLFLGNIVAGIQFPKRFSPHILVKGGLGWSKTERFSTDQLYLVTSLGAEVGVDAWVTRWIAVSPSMGYMRCTMGDAYWHSFTGKLSIGF